MRMKWVLALLLLSSPNVFADMTTEACRTSETFEQYRERIGWPHRASGLFSVQRQIPRAWSNIELGYMNCPGCPLDQWPRVPTAEIGAHKITEFHFNFFAHCLVGTGHADHFVGRIAGDAVQPSCPSDRVLAAYLGDAQSTPTENQARLSAVRSRYRDGFQDRQMYWRFSDFSTRGDCMMARALRRWQHQCYFVRNRQPRTGRLAGCPNEFDGSNTLLCEGEEGSLYCDNVNNDARNASLGPSNAGVNQGHAKQLGDDVQGSGGVPAKSSAGGAGP